MFNSKVIFIDWYKTLCSQMFIDDTFINDSIVLSQFKEQLFDVNKDLLHSWVRGHCCASDVVDYIFPNMENKKEFLDTLSSNCKQVKFDDNRYISVVSNLKNAGYRVVLATDNMDLFYDNTISNLKLDVLFDDIISSHKLHSMKRDVVDNKLPFFENYLLLQNLTYSDVVLIDDNLLNIEACKACGMHAVHVTNNEDVINTLERFLADENVNKTF